MLEMALDIGGVAIGTSLAGFGLAQPINMTQHHQPQHLTHYSLLAPTELPRIHPKIHPKMQKNGILT